jgi:hypothetical protein
MKTYLWATSVFKNCAISPILCNIYLHKLDLKVCEIQRELSICSNAKFSKKYKKVICFPKTKVFKRLPVKRRVAIMKQRQKNACKMRLNNTD